MSRRLPGCVYCGRKRAPGSVACPGHRELVAKDPTYAVEDKRPPAPPVMPRPLELRRRGLA